MNLKLQLGATDTATVKQGLTFDQGTTIGTVSFTNIENLYLQDSIGGASDRLAVPLSGSGTNAIIAGTSSGDTLTLASATYNYSAIWGQGGADTITGGSGGDTIRGQAGADTITPNGGQDNIYLGIAGDADVVIIEDDAHYGADQAATKHEVVRQFITGEDIMKFSHGDIAGIDGSTDMTSYGSSKTGATVIVDAPGSTWGGNVVAGHTAQRFLYNSLEDTVELLNDELSSLFGIHDKLFEDNSRIIDMTLLKNGRYESKYHILSSPHPSSTIIEDNSIPSRLNKIYIEN